MYFTKTHNVFRNVDPGLEEAISSILWAGPRLAAMVPELKSICEQLALKYGKDYAESCKEDKKDTISEKLKHRLGVESPTKLLVEKYLIEIAKNFNVEYEPDEKVIYLFILLKNKLKLYIIYFKFKKKIIFFYRS